MEAKIIFKVESEEEFDGILDGSILPGETWELYGDDGEIIKFAEYEPYCKPKTK